MTSGGGDNMMFTARVGVGIDGGESETGTLPVTVNGEDLSNVVIVTSKGATATGRLTFEGGAKPTTLTNIRVTASPVDMDGPMVAFAGPGTVKADGTFELKGLSGTRIVRVASLPPGWMLKSVKVNGNDVTDSGIDFKAGESVTGVDVVLTSKLTEVTGTVKAGTISGEGLHAGGVLGRSSKMVGAEQPLCCRSASGSGRPLPDQEPAARRVLRHRRRLSCAGGMERSRRARTAEGQGHELLVG